MLKIETVQALSTALKDRGDMLPEVLRTMLEPLVSDWLTYNDRILDLETQAILSATELHDSEMECQRLRADLEDAEHDHDVTLTSMNDPDELAPLCGFGFSKLAI